MAYLPDQMPADFRNNYKPIAAAGTSQQIKSLARMFAMQLNAADLIQFSKETTTTAKAQNVQNDDEDQYLDEMDNEEATDYYAPSAKLKAEAKESLALKSGDNATDESLGLPKLSMNTPTTPAKPLPTLENLVAKKKSTKLFKLPEITSNSSSEFNSQYKDELLYKTYKRILNSEGSKTR